MAWVRAHGERRCHAHKKNGEQCRLWGVVGTEPPICRTHGAAAPQVKLAAARRQADRQALAIASKVDVEIPHFTSAGDAAIYLVNRVTLRAAQFGALADQLETMVYTDASGVERLRAAIDGERKWLESMTRVLGVAVAARSAASAEPAGPSPVELFTMACELWREDVGAALTDARIEGGQREAFTAALAARARVRLRQSQGMIIDQIRIMSEAKQER